LEPHLSIQQNLRPFEIEPKPHFLQPRLRHRLPQTLAVLGIEQQEPAAARPDELSAQRAVAAAADRSEAEAKLLAWLTSYDVGAGSAGLSALEQKPDLAISAMLLPELGRGYARCIASSLAGRGWDGELGLGSALTSALTLMQCRVAQHHVQALLRRAPSAVLISAVSQVDLRRLPNGKAVADGEPRDLLSVERLVERLPGTAEVREEQSWEWPQAPATEADARSVLTLVEALFV